MVLKYKIQSGGLSVLAVKNFKRTRLLIGLPEFFFIVSCQLNIKINTYGDGYMNKTVADFGKWDMELDPKSTDRDGKEREFGASRTILWDVVYEL